MANREKSRPFLPVFGCHKPNNGRQSDAPDTFSVVNFVLRSQYRMYYFNILCGPIIICRAII